jgi:transketolase
MNNTLDELSINTLRILSVEMIQKANSGHPGTPLGAAPSVFCLWANHMKFNPKNPNWIDRDRFILSAGHSSALLYSLLFLFGYDLDINDLKNFRQLDSKTPGHPEYKHTPGVEVTTGPLGQGIASAVGMAFAESYLANKFNNCDFNLIDHFTYVLCGDGCLMEGITSEAISLAGNLKLGKLIILYDSNNITIEGNTKITFTENVLDKFKACGWHAQKVFDANNLLEINNAIENAKKNLSQPSIIEIKSIIGYGAPNKQGKESSHGSPLGLDEIKLLKKNLNWNYDKEFFVPNEVIAYISNIKNKLIKKEEDWNKLFSDYKNKYKELAEEFERWNKKEIDLNIDGLLLEKEKNLSTRDASEKIINKLANLINNLVGGSADLGPSTKTIMRDRKFYSNNNKNGSNLHFGVREHAMAGFANGVMLHGGIRIFISTFFVFSDYMKPAMRLSALMNLPVINIFTHDSIGVGEDGPTHQPIEQLACLRSIPNMTVIRPCDYNETVFAWYYAIKNISGPTAIILSRQKLNEINKTGEGVLNGAYILYDSDDPEIILMASGSEVNLICDVYKKLKDININSRVVSMTSFEIFDKQSDDYKEYVLPKKIRKRFAVEAASSFGWYKYIGLDGDIVCMNSFGASAPAEVLFKKYNFTVEKIFERVMNLI